MKFELATVTAVAATLASAANPSRRFAVLRFNGDGFLTQGRMDPIVSPGKTSAHVHGVMGGSNFGLTVDGDQLLQSDCTNAKIKNDKSNYWFPMLYFQDPTDKSLTEVPMFYMNVYYFFEATDDDIKAFPVGLKMVSGDAMTRVAPSTGGDLNLDPSKGKVQAVQYTCPRSDNYAIPLYPAGSDGSKAGIQDSGNKGAGTGFPDVDCDGYGSPLRADVHFPSCYNPAAGLNDYQNNMAFPTGSGGKQNCPKGWVHVPHIFFEIYWNTPLFKDKWTQNQGTQPFVLANGDRTGFSSHGDFISGWDVNTLQTIIDTCDAGSTGMDKCPQIPGGLNEDQTCKINSLVAESVSGPLQSLPGNNPIVGWGQGDATAGGSTSGSNGSDGSNSGSDSSSSSAAAAPVATYSATSQVEAPSVSTSSAKTSSAKPSTTLSSVQKAAATSSSVQAVSTVAIPTTTTAASAAPATSANSPAADGSGKNTYVGKDGVSTHVVWDYVTYYETKTVWGREAEPTDAVQKREDHMHHHVGHMARHARAGRSNRRN